MALSHLLTRPCLHPTTAPIVIFQVFRCETWNTQSDNQLYHTNNQKAFRLPLQFLLIYFLSVCHRCVRARFWSTPRGEAWWTRKLWPRRWRRAGYGEPPLTSMKLSPLRKSVRLNRTYKRKFSRLGKRQWVETPDLHLKGSIRELWRSCFDWFRILWRLFSTVVLNPTKVKKLQDFLHLAIKRHASKFDLIQRKNTDLYSPVL